jgi:DNA repair protein RecO (recombination protein O)
LFVTAELRWVRSRKSDLHTLAEVHWKKSRLDLRSSYGRLLAATYFTQLVQQAVEPHAPVPDVHELLTKALDFLAARDPEPRLLERFEARFAELMGLGQGQGSGKTLRLLEEISHRPIPTVRKELLQWIKSRASE